MGIRLTFRLERPRQRQVETDIFGRILPRQRRSWLPLFGSMLAHGALLVLVPVIADEVAKTYSDDIDWSVFRVEPMRLRVPDVIYYTAPGRTMTPSAARAETRRSATRRNNGANDAPRRTTTATVSPPKGIELPPIQADEADLAILQPNTSPKPHSRPSSVPPLAFWGRTPSDTQTNRNDVKLPGRAEEATSPPQLAAPPVLAVPNKELTLADRNIAAAPVVTAAMLPVTPSATAPIRENTGDPRSGVVDRMSGQSVNVISISSAPIRPGEVINLPPGSTGMRSAQVTANDRGTGKDASQGAHATSGDATREGVTTSPTTRDTAPSHRDSNVAEGLEPRQPRPAGTTMISSPANDTKRDAVAAGGSDAFKRITHPANGAFDVVVTQSSGGSELPGINARLSGSPVYTVYLHVGDVEEWVLAFCLPASKQLRNSAYEVIVDDPAPLSPPYPITTIIPQSMVAQARPTAVAFRGFITVAGALRDLSPTEPSAVAQQLAPILTDWRFRPAKKNNMPTEVEVLIIIPLIDTNRLAFAEKQHFERANVSTGM